MLGEVASAEGGAIAGDADDLKGLLFQKARFDDDQPPPLRQPLSPTNTNTTKREMKPYVWTAVENDYEVEFVEPTSKWWQKIQPMLHKKGANKKELILAAKMLADRNEHGVPSEAILRMLNRWHVNPKVEDFI